MRTTSSFNRQVYFFLVLFYIICSSVSIAGGPRINEFMASNKSTVKDKYGEYSDWIEIFNPGTTAVNLSGWALTDDSADIDKWLFPSVILGPGGYLLVFASGNNAVYADSELHTSFKLSAEGEYLGLINPEGKIVSEFNPYPEQADDISFGCYEGEYVSLTVPTPGDPNTSDIEIPVPALSKKHGFYYDPFTVEIISPLLSGSIYYTTDGSEPSAQKGILYTGPVSISTTTVFRAAAVIGNKKSRAATASYLFPDDIIRQGNRPAGYPAVWGEFIETPGLFAPADYEMDQEVLRDARYKDSVKPALLSIPTISIVTAKDNLFSAVNDPDSGGIYMYTGAPGETTTPPGNGWERPASVEYFNPDLTEEFQADCGLTIHGGHSRRPEKSPKHSFRLIFSSRYGPSKLNYSFFGENSPGAFDVIVLRSTYGNSWIHRSSAERGHTQLIHDLWAKDTQLEMGHPSGKGFYAHLYLNGIYWGIYNPTERIDKEFCSEYMGGDDDDYDVIKDYGEVQEGNNKTWNELLAFIKEGVADNTRYRKLQGQNPDGSVNPSYKNLLDIDNFIDYMIINYYGANWDWDGHNWVAAKNRTNNSQGFKFFCWDTEHVNESVTATRLGINTANAPTGIFYKLCENPEFKIRFADRVQMHLFNGGVLSPERSAKRWQKRAEELDAAIIAESARWGDYRRDVEHATSSGPYSLYTKEHWLKELEFVTKTYFPQRGNEFIKQLKEAGLFPKVPAPDMFINNGKTTGGSVSRGDTLTIKVSAGITYYTLDGTDPVKDNLPSASAVKYESPLVLSVSAFIKARTFYRSEWSPLTTVSIDIKEDHEKLKITEINYHPLPQDSVSENKFEFIELKNTGETVLNLGKYRFVRGITYLFPDNTLLQAGEFLLLVSDKEYFKNRYRIIPFDVYEGNLDNSGETIALASSAGDTIISIKYNDKEPWPADADGKGKTLVPVLKNPVGSQDNPLQWCTSFSENGSPGKDDDLSTGISAEGILPAEYFLFQNYPNPFNPATTIRFVLAESGKASLKIYDLLGRVIAEPVSASLKAGEHEIIFDASALSSGIYFYKLECSNFSSVKKMILLR